MSGTGRAAGNCGALYSTNYSDSSEDVTRELILSPRAGVCRIMAVLTSLSPDAFCSQSKHNTSFVLWLKARGRKCDRRSDVGFESDVKSSSKCSRGMFVQT